MLQKGRGDAVGKAERRRDVFASDGAHALRRGHHIRRGDGVAVGGGGGYDAVAWAGDLEHVVDHVGADVH